MEEEKKVLKDENAKEVSGGASYKGGYCPYTEDRRCRFELVGNFDPKNELCVECGWRAW